MKRGHLTLFIILILCLGIISISSPYLPDRPGTWMNQTTQRFENEPSFFSHPWVRKPSGRLSLAVSFSAMYLSGILMMFIFTDRVKLMRNAMSSNFKHIVRITSVGVVALVLMLAVGITSAMTTITFPLTFFLGGVLILSVFYGVIALVYTIGFQIAAKAGLPYISPIYALGLGLVILYTVSVIPYLGLLFRLLASSLGLGLTITTRFGSGKAWSLSTLVED